MSKNQNNAKPIRIHNKLLDADISNTAKILAACMTADISLENVTQIMDVTRNTVNKWHKELEESGLLELVKDRPEEDYVEVPVELLSIPRDEVNNPAKLTWMAISR